MAENDKSLLTQEVLEFVTVAVPFCSLLQELDRYSKKDFLDKVLKLLPLLYVKALLLPKEDLEGLYETESSFLSESVTEQEYILILNTLEGLMGEEDLFLEVLSEDMAYSDTPMTARISECLADIFQPLGNFLGILRDENFVALPLALQNLRALFEEYWGDRLLMVLRPLHRIAMGLGEEETADIDATVSSDEWERRIDEWLD